MLLVLLALAIGPGLIILHLFWAADRRREPIWNVATYVAGGAGICQLAGIVEELAGVPTDPLAAAAHPFPFAAAMILGVGLVEEAAKLLAVRCRSLHDPALDEPFDWVVYAVAVSLGFATLENLFYVLSGGVSVGIARAILSVPTHALCGTLMGTWLAEGMRIKDSAAAREARTRALVEPALWHGAYDALCGFMSAGSDMAALSQLILLTLLWRRAYLRTRALRDASAAVARPPVLYPEVVLASRAARRASRDRRRHARSLAAAMRR